MILKSAVLSVMWLRSCTEYPFQLIHYARLAKTVFVINLNNLIIYYDGYGGIGRHARFRFWCESVQVQVLLPVPATNRTTMRFV